MERAALLAYRALFPEDRARTDPLRWQAVEERHPAVFADMYAIWSRVPRA
jgi:hypothetical protein